MATTLQQIGDTLRDVFPVRGELASLELVLDEGAPASADGRVTVRLVIWETNDGAKTIRDIKEQELYFFEPSFLSGDVPILAFIRGWALAATEVLSRATIGVLETLMPHDLTDAGVLKLRKATTPEDYRAAFLAKSRLGKYLPAAVTAPS